MPRFRTGARHTPHGAGRDETMEAGLLAQGYSYETAHAMTCKAGYDYDSEMVEWKAKHANIK